MAVLVDTPASVADLVETIMKLPQGIPNLYLDLEGVSLSRHGTLSIVTIWIQQEQKAYLVDVHTLGASAFNTPIPNGITLKAILETPLITKVFFDVRNDSDAMYSHYGIKLQGIEDVQLMENAGRPSGRRRYISGLEKTIQNDAPITWQQKQAWTAVKETGVQLFHPSKGGSYEVFNQRPMRQDIVNYCINDVQFLPMLRDKLWGRLGVEWRKKVTHETENRVKESQSPTYDPQGEDKRLGPWEDGVQFGRRLW